MGAQPLHILACQRKQIGEASFPNNTGRHIGKTDYKCIRFELVKSNQFHTCPLKPSTSRDDEVAALPGMIGDFPSDEDLRQIEKPRRDPVLGLDQDDNPEDEDKHTDECNEVKDENPNEDILSLPELTDLVNQ
ncbi:hypothetical protein BDQ17DRAFT_1327100 [Cyathus striatus]|nr:hypothetical protein BDQ17DRAFT_1327100 [Cyathus striatus]